MREFNVLYGFKDEKTEASITKELQGLGCIVNSDMRYRKHMIADYIKEHQELDAVIIKEYLDGGERYGTQELVALADDSNVNIVVLLRPGHRGHDMMREIYNAGILNAYFADGSRGATPERLAELALHSRTRREAREYYKIDIKPLHKEVLEHEEFRDCYFYLLDDKEGYDMVNRFVHVSRWLTAPQMGVFIATLPEDVLDVLKQYKEFHDIYKQLYKKHYVREPLKIPKDAETALSPEKLAATLVEEAEKEPVDDTPKIEPVEIKLINRIPVPAEEDEEEKRIIAMQELRPESGRKSKKEKRADEDIRELAEKKEEKEVKQLFNFVEKIGDVTQKGIKLPSFRKKSKVAEEAAGALIDDENQKRIEEAISSMDEEEKIGGKSADELIDMFADKS